MAKLLKSRARKPLAEGGLSWSWSRTETGAFYQLSLRLPDSEPFGSYKFELDMKEAEKFAVYVAQQQTKLPSEQTPGLYKILSPADALRALADKIG